MLPTQEGPGRGDADGALPERVVLKADDVVAKVIDGEAIIMNIRSGVYYSIDDVGGFICGRIEEGYSLQEIIEAVVVHYDVSAEQARADVERLTRELLEEGIVSASEARVSSVTPRVSDAGSRRRYATPTLKTYRDMGDLLALDPPAPNLHDLRWEK